jgi:hypothetical protein
VLGGKDNYAADRAAVEAWLKVDPEMAFTARANRAFLGRAVRYLAAEAGIRQFLDIGTGIPTAGNTHEVAQAIAPESRVVYVDYDPIVLAHARALLTSGEAGPPSTSTPTCATPGTILGQAGQLLDFTKPVAVTLLSVLHAIPDADDPHAIVARVMDAVPSGSYLAISHVGSDLLSPETLQGLEGRRGPDDAAADHVPHPRAGGAVLRGTDLVDPDSCGSRNGARNQAAPARRASPVSGAQRAANARTGRVLDQRGSPADRRSHVRVAVVGRRGERLLDRAGGCPAEQVKRGARLVVRARCP